MVKSNLSNAQKEAVELVDNLTLYKTRYQSLQQPQALPARKKEMTFSASSAPDLSLSVQKGVTTLKEAKKRTVSWQGEGVDKQISDEEMAATLGKHRPKRP